MKPTEAERKAVYYRKNSSDILVYTLAFNLL